MQWLAEICVKRPVFATVLILALTVVGTFAFLRLGVDQFPKVDIPTVVITARLPGAAPEEVETEVTDRIEESVNTISGIDELRSSSAEGISQVFVSFVLEKDADVAAQEVRDKLNRVLPLLPRSVEQPTVEKLDPDSAPVLSLAVTGSGKPVRDVTEFADKVLRRQLESVTGVGQVAVVGGRQRQINIWLDATRLQAYNLTVTDVSRALQTQNSEIPGGRIEEGPSNLTLRTRGRIRAVQEFAQVVIKDRDGHPVTLGDVSTIEDGMAQAQSVSLLNGEATVILQVRRQSGTNAVEVADRIRERLGDLGSALPPGYRVDVVRDMSEFIKASIDSIEEHLVVGSVLAALVVLVFLGNLRSTLIAAIAIPTSIVSTFGLLWYMDFTLNFLTMLALTLSVGIVIDDAIVVLENIYRFIEEKGLDPFDAAIEGTREIGLAVLATTLSLAAIFVPVAFMGGIVGRFMASFGLTMAFSILVSLLVSFTLTPMLSARWLKRSAEATAGHGSKDAAIFRSLDGVYTRLLEWSLQRRGLVAAVSVLILGSSVPLFMIVDKNFTPTDDQGEFEIVVRAPEGSSLEKTELVVGRLANTLRERIPGITFSLATVGDDGARTPNAGRIYVKLAGSPSERRDQTSIMDDIRTEILPLFENEHLRTSVRAVSGMGGGGGGGGGGADVQMAIGGPELGDLERYAQQIVDAARGLPGTVDVDTSLNLGKPELSVHIDRLKAADMGVAITEAAEALRLLVGGDQVTTYNEGGEQYEVHLRANAENRTSADAITRLTVPSTRLGSVALENLAVFERGTAAAEITRLNRQRTVTVNIGLAEGSSQAEVMNALEDAAAGLNMNAAYRTRFVGRSRELERAAQNFVLAFVLSLVFMYLILAAQFESWLHPITILLSLPLTLPFALVSIIAAGQSLNIFSALGLLVLFGVVKKNSILQIDHANQLREAGADRHSAIVRASRDRLRPILMTTLAFVAGMIPLVVSGGAGAATNRAIGFVIIGGQTLVLVLSLVVTPVAYSLFDDAAAWLGGRRRLIAPLATNGLAKER